MMKSAIILNNSPKCPYCYEYDYNNLGIVDIDAGVRKGERMFQVVMICHSCNRESFYYLDKEMKNRFDDERDSDISRIIKEANEQIGKS